MITPEQVKALAPTQPLYAVRYVREGDRGDNYQEATRVISAGLYGAFVMTRFNYTASTQFVVFIDARDAKFWQSVYLTADEAAAAEKDGPGGMQSYPWARL